VTKKSPVWKACSRHICIGENDRGRLIVKGEITAEGENVKGEMTAKVDH